MSNEVLLAAGIAMQANVPIFVVGKPGIAKTSLLTLISERFGDHGYDTDVIHPALYEPTDFTGLPMITKDADGSEIVKFAPPFWAVNAMKKCVDNGGHVIVFDEVTCAPPSTQAALMRPILERHVGDLKLPANTLMIMIGNPPNQAAGGWEIAKPLMNRVVRLDWDLPFQAWADYMLSRDPDTNVVIKKLSSNWGEHITAASALVVSFLTAHRTLYSPQIPDNSDPLAPFATPRSWDMASKLMAACSSVGFDTSSGVTMQLIAGCVGEDSMTQFVHWVNEQDLPDPEKLLANPETLVMHKDRNDINFAVLTNVVSCAVATGEAEPWKRAWEVLRVAGNQGKLDIAASASRTLARNIPRNPNGSPVLPPAAIGDFAPLLEAIKRHERR